jgi:hypothetical protein
MKRMRILFDVSRCANDVGLLVAAGNLLSRLADSDCDIVLIEDQKVSPDILSLFLGENTSRTVIAARGQGGAADVAFCVSAPFYVDIVTPVGVTVRKPLFAGVNVVDFYPCPDRGCETRAALRTADEALVGLVLMSSEEAARRSAVRLVLALTECRRVGTPWTLIVKVDCANGPGIRKLVDGLIREAVDDGKISRSWWRNSLREGAFQWYQADLEVGEMRSLYNSVDFLLKPNSAVGPGLSVAEATACGTRAVTVPLPGHAENPLLVPLPICRGPCGDLRDPSATDIAEAVHKVTPGRPMREKGQAFAAMSLRWDVMAADLLGMGRLASRL